MYNDFAIASHLFFAIASNLFQEAVSDFLVCLSDMSVSTGSFNLKRLSR